MVPEGHRLRRLHVREARHHGRRVFLGPLQERRDQPFQRLRHAKALVLDPQAEIHGHLVVARARRVQPSCRRPDQLGQPRLDIHVDVLELFRELELARLDLGKDRRQPLGDLFLVGRRNYAGLGQHLGMRDRAANVLRV